MPPFLSERPIPTSRQKCRQMSKAFLKFSLGGGVGEGSQADAPSSQIHLRITFHKVNSVSWLRVWSLDSDCLGSNVGFAS